VLKFVNFNWPVFSVIWVFSTRLVLARCGSLSLIYFSGFAASEMIVCIRVVVCMRFQGLSNILKVKHDEKFLLITVHLVLHRR